MSDFNILPSGAIWQIIKPVLIVSLIVFFIALFFRLLPEILTLFSKLIVELIKIIIKIIIYPFGFLFRLLKKRGARISVKTEPFSEIKLLEKHLPIQRESGRLAQKYIPPKKEFKPFSHILSRPESPKPYLLEQKPREKTYKSIYQMSGKEFEKFITEIFEKMGYETEDIRYTKDGGLDIKAKMQGELCIIQCKRYAKKNHISVGKLREFHSVLVDEKAVKGFFITTSFFTNDSKKFGKKHKEIELMDRNDLKKFIEPLNIELIEETQ